MSDKSSSKLEKWHAKYGAVVTALSCLGSTIISWRNNWILTCFLGIGVLNCGTIGIFDIKRTITEGNNQV
ncbi:hypothetical protein [Oceanobacillus neutriphilus]|uniref:Uncharacterized protein n=1 Tax=Oceanobacillus neutriphilus TaxID=531815 RepID=A0ABQ2P1X4_9BACI|nr:hypothetical protein [Oceanobacillus neutriphilus]GGP16065.1 hypothetical protein GCM10011346_46550 [Oceanobacillus neutriphilus]